MKDFKVLLKYMQKMGYPNSDSSKIFSASGYDQKLFIRDLLTYLGEDGTNEFVENTFKKLSDETGKIRVDMRECGYNDSFFYLEIYNFFVDINLVGVEVQGGVGGGQVNVWNDDGVTFKVVKYEDLNDYLGIGDWNDLEDDYRRCAEEFIYKHCGFNLYFG